MRLPAGLGTATVALRRLAALWTLPRAVLLASSPARRPIPIVQRPRSHPARRPYTTKRASDQMGMTSIASRTPWENGHGIASLGRNVFLPDRVQRVHRHQVERVVGIGRRGVYCA